VAGFFDALNDRMDRLPDVVPAGRAGEEEQQMETAG
jgi:hypothetical protein